MHSEVYGVHMSYLDTADPSAENLAYLSAVGGGDRQYFRRFPRLV